MDSLAEDLVLLAIDPGNGVVHSYGHLHYGIAGAELVALAEAGHIDLADDKIIVTGLAASTGDPDLDATLASLGAARRPPKPRGWIGKSRGRATKTYLTRLVEAGAIERSNRLLVRYTVIDTARMASLRSRVDAVALGAGPAEVDAVARGAGPGEVDAVARGAGPADSAQQAYAALVSAVGLAAHLYRGWDNRGVRKRMHQLAKTHWAASAVQRAVAAADSTAAGAVVATG
jgi:hypothetical protein